MLIIKGPKGLHDYLLTLYIDTKPILRQCWTLKIYLRTLLHDLIAIKSSDQEILAVLLEYLAIRADPVVATSTLEVLLDEFVMEVVMATHATDEGFTIGQQTLPTGVLLSTLG